MLQGGSLVRQVGQQLCVPLSCTAREGPAVGFAHLCQAVGRWGTVGRAGPAQGPLEWPRCSRGAGVPRTQRLGRGLGSVCVWWHSLVEEQQIGRVECEVTLEAMLGSQVGQAAELGMACSVLLPPPAPSSLPPPPQGGALSWSAPPLAPQSTSSLLPPAHSMSPRFHVFISCFNLNVRMPQNGLNPA